MAQVSVNITDFEQTAIHTVYEEICKDAQVMLHFFIEISVRTDFKKKYLKVEAFLINSLEILLGSVFIQT